MELDMTKKEKDLKKIEFEAVKQPCPTIAQFMSLHFPLSCTS